MARRPTTRARPVVAEAPPVDKKELVQEIIDTIKKALDDQEVVVSVRGPFMTSVVLQDGNYKQKPVNPDQELLFKGMRPGARSAIIFEFEPIAHCDFKQVEFEEKKIFLAMPDFEQTLVNMLGYYEDMTWPRAAARFIKEAGERRAAEEEARRAEIAATNAADPMWGIF